MEIKDVLANIGFNNNVIDFASSNREIWDNVPKELKEYTIKEAEKIQDEKWDAIPLSLYQEFSKNGNRENFQKVYFKKRKHLSILVTAECLEDKGRFIPAIADGIWSILSEPAWVIPAHNCYIRDTKQLTAPLTERPILDLFACESGEIISLSIQLLKQSLADIIGQPFIDTVKYELRKRILYPYLNDHFWWMGGNGGLNNWTVWCTQNVLLSISALDLSKEELAKAVNIAMNSIQEWLDQYGEDGCCDEGASYWHAAGLCLWGCLEILDKMSAGRASVLFEDRKVRNIGHYIISVLVSDDIYLNFADCSPKAGRLGAREYLFGKALNDKNLMAKALLDWKFSYKQKYIDKTATPEPIDENYNLWYRVIDLISSREMFDQNPYELEKEPSFVSFPSTGLYIYREKDLTLAVKAGCNADSHNHNDVGSVILYKGTHPLLIDVGVETYSAKTFSSERYTLWPMQSFYHNLCNFGSVMQKDGKEFRATDIKADETSISMEIKNAYPEEAKLESYRREVSFENGITTIKDCIKGQIPPTLSIMTSDMPTLVENGLAFGSWNIELSQNKGIKIEQIDISDERLRRAWPDKLYRTLVSFDDVLIWRIVTK